MPYRVIAEGDVAILNKIGEMQDGTGTVIADEHETLSWKSDELIPDDKVAPCVVAAYEAGDEHVTSLLAYEEDVEEKPKARQGRATKAASDTDKNEEGAA